MREDIYRMNKKNMYGKWFDLMFESGLSIEKLVIAAEIFQILHILYDLKQRAYHNMAHIWLCLDRLDAYRELQHIDDWKVVAFAIWFHDAIYDPKRNDNEEKSAQIARECLDKLGFSHLSDKVSEMIILGTKHFEGDVPCAKFASQEEVDLMHDLDLVILGCCEKMFEDYACGIREEYIWVERDIYRKKRVEILKKFLDRKRIYRIEFFYDRYERYARKNMEESIAMLTLC